MTSVHPTPEVLAAAARLLDQCDTLIDASGGEGYCSVSGVLAGGTIGKHLRHTLDHYAAILAGIDQDRPIEYDRRERGGSVETDRAAARDQISTLREGLASMADRLDAPVRIRVMLAGDGSETELPSTLAREVAFATHHGIHHVAMIKAICTELGVDLDDEVGKAPSTVNHERGERA